MLHVVQFGSFVYGTNTPASDRDLVLITDEAVDLQDYGDADVQIYDPIGYQQHLTNHEPWAIEVFFTSPTVKNDFTFKLDLVKLRHAFSAVTSNAYVKCVREMQEEIDRRNRFKIVLHWPQKFMAHLAYFGIWNPACADRHDTQFRERKSILRRHNRSAEDVARAAHRVHPDIQIKMFRL